ncbi:signal recognition particle receptor subunit beta [Orussus abietinus]|uniref:signal recognition particle receptor subunit beta n=1 Tax=Orussus abietinus TaxID=222816 RepID=UPI000626AD28|nr:signal recognition particle receptor subunit beta [Orussus abietinus]
MVAHQCFLTLQYEFHKHLLQKVKVLTMENIVKPLVEDAGMSQFMGIIAAIIAIIVTLVLFALWRRRGLGNTVLLVGLCDSGKTLLFARLVGSKYVDTYTSINENIGGDLMIDNRPLKIIDVPGHERLRYKFFDKFKSSAKGLIFVIDSVTLQKDIRDVADFLYSILSDPLVQRSLPVLILCNKQDQIKAKGCQVIKALLEKEMNLLKFTKANQLEATDSSSPRSSLGKQEKDFDFSDLTSIVDFAESSAATKGPELDAGIEQPMAWLQKIA